MGDSENKVITHITDDSISWIASNWRFYISNDDKLPYWGFVHKNGDMEMETALLSQEDINKIIELLTCGEGVT